MLILEFAFLFYDVASAGTNRNLRSSNEQQSRVLTEWTNPTAGGIEPLPPCFTTYRKCTNTDDHHAVKEG